MYQNVFTLTTYPQKLPVTKRISKKKQNHLPNPEKPHIKCPKLASAPSSSAACTSSMEPGRSDWQASGGGWWVGLLETPDGLVGRLDGEIWTPPKKKMEKKSELTPPVESESFGCVFFCFLVFEMFHFLLEGIMAALTKLLGNYHQLDWAGKS